MKRLALALGLLFLAPAACGDDDGAPGGADAAMTVDGAAVDGPNGGDDDAGVDAPGGGTDADPGTTLACGSMTCDPMTQLCCVTGGFQPMYSCIPQNGNCNNGAVQECDGPEDCPDPQVCCLAFTGDGIEASCQASCGPQEGERCHTDSDCSTSQRSKCCDSQFLGKSCQAQCFP